MTTEVFARTTHHRNVRFDSRIDSRSVLVQLLQQFSRDLSSRLPVWAEDLRARDIPKRARYGLCRWAQRGEQGRASAALCVLCGRTRQKSGKNRSIPIPRPALGKFAIAEAVDSASA